MYLLDAFDLPLGSSIISVLFYLMALSLDFTYKIKRTFLVGSEHNVLVS